MSRFSIRLAATLLLTAGPVFAQDPAPAPAPSPVKLTLDIGLVAAAGNTDVTTFNLGNGFEYKTSESTFSQFTNVIYGKTGDSTTAEQMKGGVRLEHQLVSVVHVFVGVTGERNRFAGIARRFEEFAGLSLKLVDRPTDVWTFDVGSSINQQRSIRAVTTNSVALRFGTLYRHNFNKTAYLSQSAETLPDLSDSRNLLFNSESVIVAPLAGRLAFKISYLVKYDNLPEPGFRKTDRVLSSGLQISL